MYFEMPLGLRHGRHCAGVVHECQFNCAPNFQSFSNAINLFLQGTMFCMTIVYGVFHY